MSGEMETHYNVKKLLISSESGDVSGDPVSAWKEASRNSKGLQQEGCVYP